MPCVPEGSINQFDFTLAGPSVLHHKFVLPVDLLQQAAAKVRSILGEEAQ